jgi:RNA polymerase sigma-70 factor, ECF subfamily
MIPAVRRDPAREIDDLTLARAQRGEAGACRELVLHYQRAVFSLLGRMLYKSGREGLVEDLAQETFLKAFRALAGFSSAGAARLSTWILTIATRLALDELRKGRREAPLDEAAEVAAAHDPERAADRRFVERALVAAIERLSPEQRAVVLLREMHELDYDEIARVLEVDVGTVKSRLSRARTILRAALGEVHDG